MKWQVKYALENIRRESGVISAEHAGGDAIRISVREQPDVLAVISDTYKMDAELAARYYQQWPEMDFLCGYRKECLWEGGAIAFLEDKTVGWGNYGSLGSAIPTGSVRKASHKNYVFSYRMILQLRYVTNIRREFDRVFTLTLSSGRSLRIGMIWEYEPTADAVRSLWDSCGAVDIAWNTNPNGSPAPSAIEAGRELGCKILKWDELKAILLKG